MLGIAVVRAYDQNANLTANLSIDHRVRKVLHRVHATEIARGSAYAGKLDQQRDYAIEFVEEKTRELCPALSAIKTSLPPEGRVPRLCEVCRSSEAGADAGDSLRTGYQHGRISIGLGLTPGC